ncbi:hypothetical protein HDU76_001173, partial [Blyttiomyces sp. JEL0837]
MAAASGVIVNISDDGIATITLDNERRANSLSAQMVKEFLEALDRLETDDAVRVVIITGKGKYFCSGMDLAAASSSTSSSPFDSSKHLFNRLQTFPKPTIALANGPALGGGVGLLLCTDIRLMLSSAYIQLTEVRRGLIPAIISLYIIPEIGRSRARQWFLSGE